MLCFNKKLQKDPMRIVVPDAVRRTELYDWVRLIATIMVVIGHSVYTDGDSTYGGVSYVFPDNLSPFFYGPVYDVLRHLWFWVYSYHMPLFFVLSGAVLCLKPVGNIDIFIKKKIRRLLVPYALTGWLFMLPVKYISDFYTREGFLQAMKGLLLGVDSGHLWFLPTLFWCTLIFVLIQKLMQRLGVNSSYMLLLTAGLISLTYESFPFDVFYLKNGMRNMIWLALGYVFETERKQLAKWSNVKLIFSCMPVFLLSYFHREYDILSPFYVSVLGCVRIFLLAGFCARVFPGLWGTRRGKLLSRNLFNVYLFHDPLEYLILKIFSAGTWLTTTFGCVMYFISRLLFVWMISVWIGECVRAVSELGKRFFQSYDKDGVNV